MEMKQVFAFLLALVVVGSFLPGAMAKDSQDDSDDSYDDSDYRELNSTSKDVLIRERAEVREEFRQGRNETREEFKKSRDALELERKQLRDEFKNGSQNMTKEERERLREEFKDAREGMKEDRKKMLDDLKAHREQLREEYKHKIEALKEEFKKNAERQKELREEFKKERDDLKENREKFKNECKESNSTAVCNEYKEKVAEGRKDILGNAAEQVLKAIINTKARVETNPNVDDATQEKVLAMLDKDETAIKAAQAKIDALTNSSTLNETKAAADALKTAMTQARVDLKLAGGVLINSNFEKFLNQMNLMSEKFKQKSDNLSASGKDTTKLDSAIEAFDAKIANVTAAYVDAKSDFADSMGNVSTEKDAEALIKSMREQLHAANKEAQDARIDLKAIVKELRALDANALADVSKQMANESATTDSLEVETEVSA